MILAIENLSSAPELPGVYIFLNKNEEKLYVGKAKNLKKRLASYKKNLVGEKTAKMLDQAVKIRITVVASEFEALLLEANLVRAYLPKYNSELKDDKSPIYIVITKEQYPRLISVRQTQLAKLKTKHTYGPFLDAGSTRKVLRILKTTFKVANHKPGKRGCLQSQINLCYPCPSVIEHSETEEAKRLGVIYRKNVASVTGVLSGRLKYVRKNLEKEMQTLAHKENFEEAKEVRAKIQSLDKIVEREKINTEDYIKDPNLIEDIRAKELLALENALKKYIKVGELTRIECFDIAHTAGSYPTASMVTFIDGDPDKTMYRHFRVSLSNQNNDTASMASILMRRKKHFKDWGKPDLIIVDGGKPQVKAALNVFYTDVPVVGLAKRLETLVFKVGDEYFEQRLHKGPARNLVQRMRDEAHRFARRYHHGLIAKEMFDKMKP